MYIAHGIIDISHCSGLLPFFDFMESFPEDSRQAEDIKPDNQTKERGGEWPDVGSMVR